MDELLLQFIKDKRELQLMINLRKANANDKNVIVASTCPWLIKRIIGNCYMLSDAELEEQKQELETTIQGLLNKVTIRQML